MTDRELKDYYLTRIKRLLISMRTIPLGFGIRAKKIEEEMKIIMWNNSKDWTKTFMDEEVIPLLRKYGVKISEWG